jgi:hypothetical protein
VLRTTRLTDKEVLGARDPERKAKLDAQGWSRSTTDEREPYRFGVLNGELDYHNYCSEEALDLAILAGDEKPKNKCALSDQGRQYLLDQLNSCDLSTADQKLGRVGTCSIYLKNEGSADKGISEYEKLYGKELLQEMEEKGTRAACTGEGYFFIQYVCLMP